MSVLPRLLFYATLCLVSMLYGMVSYSQELPPFSFLMQREDRQVPESQSNTDSGPWDREVSQELTLLTADDAVRQRRQLIEFMWGVTELPSALPVRVDREHVDDRFSQVPGLAAIDRLEVSMDYHLQSFVFHFRPHNPNDRVVVYHYGHGGGFEMDTRTIAAFLARGYAVAALAMPLEGLNGQSSALDDDKVVLIRHTDFERLVPRRGHPVRYFVEPVIVTLNYLEREYDYGDIAMVGLSGGGWTTTVAAAIDTRIRSSFPVAGSSPVYLRRVKPQHRGDWEETVPALYQRVSYLDMYVLGGSGTGRKQLQVLNQYDPCCFEGLGWQSYRDSVNARVRLLGDGSFDVFNDDSHREHKISEAAIARILSELN